MNLLNLRIFTVLITICLSILQANAIKDLSLLVPKTDTIIQDPSHTDSIWHTFVADTNKWHPEEIYVVYPDTQLTFKLPHEKDQSGVHNLLFQSKETGEIFLVDTINQSNERWYSLLIPGKYDVILLYNNGKYIRYSDVSLKVGINTDVDMKKLSIHPVDSLSQQWLSLRAFDTKIGKRYFNSHTPPNSKIIIRGYVFNEKGEALFSSCIFRNRTMERQVSDLDGYFEFGVTDTTNGFDISCLGYKSQKIDLTTDCGLVVILKEAPEQMNMIIK